MLTRSISHIEMIVLLYFPFVLFLLKVDEVLIIVFCPAGYNL